MRAWYSAWADSTLVAALGLQVEGAPQLAGDVEAVQAKVVLGPARAERGGEVAIAGPVDPVHPLAQLGQRGAAFVAGESPPGRCRAGPVPVTAAVFCCGAPAGEFGDLPVDGVEAGQGGGVFGEGAADRGDHAGQLVQLPGQGGVVGCFAGVEGGVLVAAGGELVQDRGQGVRVGGHGQFQGKDESSWPEVQPGGRKSGHWSASGPGSRP